MKKRILAALLCGLMVLGSVGCGEKKEEAAPAPAPEKTEEAAEAPTEPKETVTIKFFSGDSGAKATVEKIVDNYNNGRGKENGVYVELTVTTDNTKEIEMMQANGTLPDMCKPSNAQMAIFTANGDMASLDMFEGGEEWFATFDSPETELRNVFDGKKYFPYTGVQTAGLVINKDLFKAAGIVDENGEAKAPTTWEEMREYAKLLTNPSENVYGYAFPYAFSTFYTIEAPFATSMNEKSEYINYDELTVGSRDGFRDAFELMMAMEEDGSLFPGADTLDNDTARAYFAEGKIGMIPSVSWDIGVYTTQFPAKCDWAVVPAPVQDTNNVRPAYSSYGGGYSLTKTALEHPEAAFDFYQYYYSDEVLLIMAEENGTLLRDEELMAKANVDEHCLQYLALADPDYDLTVHPSYTVEGEKVADMYKKVWAGQMTADEAEKTYAENQQAGLKKAVEEGKVDLTGFTTK